MMNTVNRMLTVTADGEPLSFSGRARLSGLDGLSLFPALYTLKLWNLPDEAALRLFRCREIAVSRGESCLLSGAVSDASSSQLSPNPPRAMLTPSGLMIIMPGGMPNPVTIAENDLTDAPAFVNGGKLAILSCAVSGWRPGQTAEVRWKGISFRGIIQSRLVDADTGSGPWKCEMICEVL